MEKKLEFVNSRTGKAKTSIACVLGISISFLWCWQHGLLIAACLAGFKSHTPSFHSIWRIHLRSQSLRLLQWIFYTCLIYFWAILVVVNVIWSINAWLRILFITSVKWLWKTTATQYFSCNILTDMKQNQSYWTVKKLISPEQNWLIQVSWSSNCKRESVMSFIKFPKRTTTTASAQLLIKYNIYHFFPEQTQI